MNLLTSKVPKFDMILPLTKEKVEYRPFLVKEEKLLLMAADTPNTDAVIKAIGDIVHNCTFGKIDVKTAPMYVTQFAFLQIRGKSIGETIDFTTICGNCQHKTDTSIGVADFGLVQTPGHKKTIDLGNGITLEMRYPTIEHFSRLFESQEADTIFDIVAECIDRIITDEEVVQNTPDMKRDMLEFVDHLTPTQFEAIQKFVVTMPVLRYSNSYACPNCQTENEIVIDGINHFFG